MKELKKQLDKKKFELYMILKQQDKKHNLLYKLEKQKQLLVEIQEIEKKMKEK